MKHNFKGFLRCLTDGQTSDMLFDEIEKSDEKQLLSFALPNLITYVWWVLKDSTDKKTETLYFIGDSGYLLKQIADVLIKKYSLAIECRYLCCSTQSLAIPAYRLMDDEKYRLICRSGYGVSPAVILGRLFLNEKERDIIYNDISYDNANEHTHLSNSGRKRFAKRLRTSKALRAMVLEKSSHAYDNTIGYLKQEGLFSGKRFALVSLGFTGANQRALRILLESNGFKGRMRGYYYGLYEFSFDSRDGVYQTFYFSPHSKVFARLKFNRHLLESICCAPHTEVIGYAQKFSEYSPIFTRSEEETNILPLIKKVQAEILSITEKIADNATFKHFKIVRLLSCLKRINSKTMYTPTLEFAKTFENISYHNGISEINNTPLAFPISHEDIKNYRFFTRLKLRKRATSDENTSPCILWEYGSLAISEDIKNKAHYHHSFALWQLARMFFSR